MAATKINEGTQTTIQTIQVGGTETPVVRIDQGAGATANPFSGTILAVTNLAGGTVSALTTGSVAITVGTITAGTTTSLGIFHPNEFATVVSGTGTATGTIRAAVPGSIIYVTGLVIAAGTGTANVGLSSGTPTSNNVLGTIPFGATGGLALTPIDPPLRTTSGSALVWSQAGTSNVSITAVGFIK